jgi:hypothetical protein
MSAPPGGAGAPAIPVVAPTVPTVPAVAPVAPATVVFAEAPGLMSSNIIDYGSTQGAKLFIAATKELPAKFDGKSKNLKPFLSAIHDRSIDHGWNRILVVPSNLAVTGSPSYHLLTQYGKLSLAQVSTHALTYVNSQTREQQDSRQLYQCINASLTQEAKVAITLRAQDYIVGGKESGACLLKVLIELASIDTQATTRFLRSRLMKLDEYMVTCNSNVETFNQYVLDQTNSLHARGEETLDLVVNLFIGYLAASDKKFVDYILRRRDDYDHGNLVEADALMRLALLQYRALVDSGEWNSPDKADARIIALESQVVTLRSANNKGQGKKANTKTKSNSNAAGYGGKGREAKPEWMTKKPKDGEPNKKVVNEKDYWWCPKHEAWTRHTPEQCEGKGVKPSGKKTKGKSGNNKGSENGERMLKLSQAFATIADSSQE